MSDPDNAIACWRWLNGRGLGWAYGAAILMPLSSRRVVRGVSRRYVCGLLHIQRRERSQSHQTSLIPPRSDLNTLYRSAGKRTIDVVVAVMVLILALPLLVVVSIVIPLETRGPIFFVQERLGRGARRIRILKFRTMTHEARAVGNEPIIGRAEGVTRFGYLLRRLKIDELPQILNVIRGDMSLVGPRPNIQRHLAEMTEEDKQRYDVRPGMTGLAQVSGNIHLSWRERFACDRYYIKNYCLRLDLAIVTKTVAVVLLGERRFHKRPVVIFDEMEA